MQQISSGDEDLVRILQDSSNAPDIFDWKIKNLLGAAPQLQEKPLNWEEIRERERMRKGVSCISNYVL